MIRSGKRARGLIEGLVQCSSSYSVRWFLHWSSFPSHFHDFGLGFTLCSVPFDNTPEFLIQLPLQHLTRLIPSFFISHKKVQFLDCMQNRLALRLRWIVYWQLERLPDLSKYKPLLNTNRWPDTHLSFLNLDLPLRPLPLIILLGLEVPGDLLGFVHGFIGADFDIEEATVFVLHLHLPILLSFLILGPRK
jgi:hypothetical protein